MADNDAAIAAEWWANHSGSPMGKRYAQMINDQGEGHALARGQLAAIIRKGVVKGRAAGISMAGMVSESDKPKRKRVKSKG